MASTSPPLGKEPSKFIGLSRDSSITSAAGKESRLAQGLKVCVGAIDRMVWVPMSTVFFSNI